MKTFSALVIGLFLVIGFMSSAEAITITLAEVQNGVVIRKSTNSETSPKTFGKLGNKPGVFF